MYIDGTIRGYLDDLAAKRPTPGGGSAAALAASLGAGLMLMVAHYTVGTARSGIVDEEIAELANRVSAYKRRLDALIDKDAEAYGRLAEAIAARADGPRLDALYREALDPPYEVCTITAETLPLCLALAEQGNRRLVTDTAAAAFLLEGAFFAARWSVAINLKYIRDTAFVQSVRGYCDARADELPRTRARIIAICEKVVV